VGLAASIALLLLSLPSSLFAAKDNSALPIDGTGILHAIWLYRNHPELETLLEQVDHPTEENLRDAGMVQTRLVGGPQRRRPGFTIRRKRIYAMPGWCGPVWLDGKLEDSGEEN
jgi:hypothetical protein